MINLRQVSEGRSATFSLQEWNINLVIHGNIAGSIRELL